MNGPLIVSWLLMLAPVVWLVCVLVKFHRHNKRMRELEAVRKAVATGTISPNDARTYLSDHRYTRY